MNIVVEWKIVIRMLVALSVLIPLVRPARAFNPPPPPNPPAQVFISSTGNDTLACTQSSPCRTIYTAASTVAAGGQVWILDSGNFSASVPTIITKSMTIQAVPGALANLTASSGQAAVQVNAPGGTVAFRNLTISDQDGLFPGVDGIDITAAGVVSIENCLFADTRRNAVYALGTNAVVHISNTTFRNVAGWAVSAEDGPTVDITGSRLLHTGGVLSYARGLNSTTLVSVTDTTISDGGEGVSAQTGMVSGTARAFVTRSTIFGTTSGLFTIALGGPALITVSNSSITGNQNAFSIQGGAIQSLGNNYIADNGPETGTLTTIPLR